jgi:hypothetical protein
MSEFSITELPPEVRATGLAFRLRSSAEMGVAADWSESLCAAITAEFYERPVVVRSGRIGAIDLLELDALGAWAIDGGSGAISMLRAPLDSALLADILEGPVLLHALAGFGAFALHASAVRWQDGAVQALIADSGTGKSTLAAHAIAHGWQRVADDLLPVTAEGERGALAWPRYRQPKLPADAQWPGPESLPLGALVALQRGPSTRREALTPAAAADLFLRNTVATRIFSRAGLAAHLQASAAIAGEVAKGKLAAWRLTVPDRADDLSGAAAEALAALVVEA